MRSRLSDTATKKVVRTVVSDFEKNLKEFDQRKPFADFQIDLHVETLRLRKAHRGSLSELMLRRDFVVALYATLVSWGMGRRSVQLVGLAEFAKGLRRIAKRAEFTELSHRTLARLGRDTEKVAGNIWTLVVTLDPTKGKSKLVAGTKALHHVFPKLVPPVDRKYTGGFFRMPFSNSKRHEADFTRVFCLLADAANRIDKSRRARRAVETHIHSGMHTSLPKMIDNALVGDFYRHQRGKTRSK